MDLYKFFGYEYDDSTQVTKGIGDIDQEADITGDAVSGEHTLEIKTIIWYIPKVQPRGCGDDPEYRGDHVEPIRGSSAGSQQKTEDDDHVIELKSLVIIADKIEARKGGQHYEANGGTGITKDLWMIAISRFGP